MLVECHVVVANKVVAFLASAFGCGAIAPLFPGQHRLTDVNATVVNDISFYNSVAVGLHNFSERPPQ